MLLLNDKRELNRRPIYYYRCDQRLKATAEGSTRLVYTGLHEGQEPLKIETRLTNEKFASVMGECENVAIGAPPIVSFKVFFIMLTLSSFLKRVFKGIV